MPHSNLTARAARWSATHRRAAIGGWLAVVVVVAVLGGMVGFKTPSNDVGDSTESARADRTIAHAFADHPSEQVIVQSPRLVTTDARFRDTVTDVVRRLRAAPHTRDVRVGAASRDRHSTLVEFRVDDAEHVNPSLAASRAAAAAHRDLFIGQFGESSLDSAVQDSISEDLGRAELFSLPLTLVILLFAVGGFVAALVPLLLAMSAVAAAIGVVSLLSHVMTMTDTVTSVVLLIGLAVGVDYSLFYLRRFREERAAGRDADAALVAAGATSGHAVLVSGVTVMIAMAGQFLAGSAVFTALAVGSIVVVAVALLASVSVLPALLSKLGRRVEGRRAARASRLWGWVLGRVLRRPGRSLAIGVAVLTALSIPALNMHTGIGGMDTVGDNVAVKPAYERIERAFPGGSQPADVVVSASDVRSPAVARAIGRVGGTARISADGTVADVTVPLGGDGTNAESVRDLRHLRDVVLPAAFAGTGAHVDVTGVAAGTTDFADLMRERGPLVFAFVLGLAFVLLLVTFRSIVIPVKAIALNLLSVGASYGILEIVFHGVGDKPIVAWLPMFLFVVLFGLSMDYHVFIVSRIRELVDAGRSTEDAVREGISSTAGVVTSAAAIMVAVFAVFGTLSMLDMQEMGVGLAVAVLLDATIIRGVLLPAAMTLLGDWNWYLPSFRNAPRVPVSRRAA
jgi:RND superfamily putative drug exporter